MRYILYARKSTEDEDRQILSIQAQLAELHSYSAKEKLEIVASFEEAKTAKEPGKTSARTMWCKMANSFLTPKCNTP